MGSVLEKFISWRLINWKREPQLFNEYDEDERGRFDDYIDNELALDMEANRPCNNYEYYGDDCHDDSEEYFFYNSS